MTIGKVSLWLLMTVCLFALTDAFNFGRVQTMYADDSSEIDVETMETLEKLQELFEAIQENGGHCSCTGLNCQCCLDIRVKIFSAKFCLSLSFSPSTGTATVSGTFNGRTVFQKTFQVLKAIPPLCFNYKVAKICLEFYDFYLDSKEVRGCARVSLKFFGKKLCIRVGCINIKFLDASAPYPLVWFPVVDVDNSEGGVFYVLENGLDEDDQSFEDGNQISK